MRKVSERYYFVLYDGALTLKMSKMALNSFCDKTLQFLPTPLILVHDLLPQIGEVEELILIEIFHKALRNDNCKPIIEQVLTSIKQIFMSSKQ